MVGMSFCNHLEIPEESMMSVSLLLQKLKSLMQKYNM